MDTVENMELDDLVYTYPDQYDPDIQTLISAKEEFKEVEGLPNELPPKRGQLFRHQKVLKRIMMQYDQQFLIHATGSGKGCSVYSVTEHYKALAGALEELRKQNTPSTPFAPQQKTLAPAFKRAYILVKGKNLVDEMKFQLLCKCTAGDYITQQILDSKTDKQRKSNVTRSVSKYYTIQTYGTFASELLKYSDDRLIEEFSNCIFVVDEVHNISNDDKGGYLRKDPITGNEYYVHMKKGEERIMENRLIYDQLFRLFHKTFPRKVMLLSATPMINDASEIRSRMNLILPLDRQIPDNINWKTVTIDELEPYFRGMISYVRALDTGAIPVYQGEAIQARYKEEDITEEKEGAENERPIKAQMVVYASEMEEKQAKVYKIAVEDPLKLRPDSENPEAFDDLKRQVANFVFPDNSTGSDGYKKYVIENKSDFSPTEEFKKWLSDPEKLREMSAKYYEIVRLCKTDPGNCWVYSHYVRTTGAIVLGLCFEYQGFEKFSENRSIFSMTGEGGLAPICGGKSLDEVKGDRFVRIPKKLRYAVLTPEVSGPEQTALLEAFNSYENRYGEYIKAIIGSPVTRDGLNFANVLQIHLSGPAWNQASSYQAESRAIRSTSHVDLLEEEKQRLIREGKNPENAFIPIKVYRHAAVDDEGESIDIKMYQESEIKDRQIKRIMRMMKIVAVDCQINYRRNVRPTDIDYSPTCDYDICAYKCFSPLPRETDYSSYDVLYSNDLVEGIKEDIKDIFRVIFSISFEELYEELKGYRRKFIDMAVAGLIENRTPITDRYGFWSYLREDGGTLFLRNEYPLTLTEKRGGISTLEYTSNLIAVKNITLEEYNGMLQLGLTTQNKEKGVLSIIAGLSPTEANAKIDGLTLENKINLLETAINFYYVEDKKIPEAVNVLQKFKPFINIEYEPVKALELSNKFFSDRGKGRGRKPKEGSKFKLNDKQEKEIEAVLAKRGKNVVYFHNLSGTGQAQTSYALTAKSRKTKGKIRILRPEEKIGWRDTNEPEDVVYNEIIKNKEEKIEFDIYGTILEDGEFRIIDKTTEDKSRAAKDTRSRNRGRKCRDGWKVPELINLMWKIQYNPFNVEIPHTKEQMATFIDAKNIAPYNEIISWPRERLEFYYKWAEIPRGKICELLKEHFQTTGRILNV